MFDLTGFNLQYFVLNLSVLIVALTIHEFAHAFSADRLGDPTPRRQGRISLFPTDHLDPMGTIFMVLSSLTGWGIGWGKPVMVNPANFKHPRRDDAIVSAAGPASNVLQALVFAGALHLFYTPAMSDTVLNVLLSGVFINLGLAFFNLIPLAPLDGHWILGAVLPRQQADRYMLWMRQYGAMVFIVIILVFPSVVRAVIGPPIEAVASMLLRGVA